jgi:YD repeat-containing protein
MKSLLLATMFILSTCPIASAQDKDWEARFYKDRAKIGASKIKEITEEVSQYWKNTCIKDSAEIAFKYHFNESGDLTRIDEFHKGHYWKTTKYVRNKKGLYTGKSYAFYDSLDNVKRIDNWILKFDKKRRKTLEIWVSGNDTIRVNKLFYDRKGNYIEQFTDGWIKWRFRYDDKNHLIESEECRLQADTLQCYNLTKYQYENELIKRYVVYSKGEEIWKEFDYEYDAERNLTKVKEQRRVFVQYGDEPKRKVIYSYATQYENDNLGHCIAKSEFSNNEVSPFRCTYYYYKYY